MTTDKHGRGNRQMIDLSATVPWENTSGETIPAFGVVQLRDDFDAVSKAGKPNSYSGLFFVNGPVTVAASGFGESLVWNKPRKVLTYGDLVVGDSIGPVPGQWYMSADGHGWMVLHQGVDNVAVVVQHEINEEMHVEVLEDIFAAVNWKRDPSTGQVRVYRTKSNGDLTATDRIETVVNRFENISFDKGQYARIKRLGREYVFTVSDCPGGSESVSESVSESLPAQAPVESEGPDPDPPSPPPAPEGQ